MAGPVSRGLSEAEKEHLLYLVTPAIYVYPDEARQRWTMRAYTQWWLGRNGNSIQISQSAPTVREDGGGGEDDPGDVRRVECGDGSSETAGAGDAREGPDHPTEAAGATAMTESFQEMAGEIIAGLTAERDAARAMACFYHESLRRIAAISRDGPGLAGLAAARAELPWLKVGEERGASDL